MVRVRVTRAMGVSTFQDGGRPGYRAYGVTPGGAFDRGSMAVANALLGQDFDCPVIELGGPLAMEFMSGGTVALAGAPFSARISNAPAALPGRIEVAKGEVLAFGPGRVGARAYLAAPGGWDVPLALGSVSGHPLRAGEEYASTAVARRLDDASLSDPAESLGAGPLRFVPLDEDFDWAPDSPLSVSPQSDRVGVRLIGAGLVGEGLAHSEPSVWGVMQATPAGEILIHGPDGPTIGGYQKIGTVVRADHDRIGQLRPGDHVTLAAVELGEAKRLAAQREEDLARLVTFLRIRTGTV